MKCRPSCYHRLEFFPTGWIVAPAMSWGVEVVLYTPNYHDP